MKTFTVLLSTLLITALVPVLAGEIANLQGSTAIMCGSCTAGKACAKPAAEAGKKGGCGGKCQKVKAEAQAAITVSGLQAILKSGVPVIVLDARSAKYDDGRRVPGAKSLTDAQAEEKAAKIIPGKDSLVVTYCSNKKCPASARLAKKLHELGYANVVEMPAGIDGWEAAGNKVEKSE